MKSGLFIVLISTCMFVGCRSQSSDTTLPDTVIPSAETQTSNEKLLDIPEKFPVQGWVEIPLEEDEFYSTMYIDDARTNESYTSRLPGKLYKLAATAQTPDEDPTRKFNSYWAEQLSKIGWKFYIETADFTLKPPSADGGLGGSSGNIVFDGTTVRMISWGYSSHALPVARIDASDNNRCPCEYELELFISDPISIDKIFANKQKY